MLYGTYINLVHPDLYGHQLTYGFLEGLARNYVWHPTSNYNYEDKTVRPTIDAIWNTMYNNVANVNSILKDIKSRKDLFINNLVLDQINDTAFGTFALRMDDKLLR